MNIFDTYYMLAAIKELPLEHTFFRDRYFPSNTKSDIFGTSKVLVDYKEGTQKLAPFVIPRVGGVSVMRSGFETFEIEPPNISLSMPLTSDHLKNRGFGEALHSTMTSEDREQVFLLGDMDELSSRISRREEWIAAETILNNGCIMKHITDKDDVYEEVEVRFYKGINNPSLYTPATPWTDGDPGWRQDVAAMAKMLRMRGMPTTDLILSADVGEFILRDEYVQKLLDNRRMEMGRIDPKSLAPGVVHLGTLNFTGVLLDILVNDETYEDENGNTVPYLPSGTVIITAPGCGHTLYGAVTQLENDGNFHTHANDRVPQHLFTIKPPVKETQVTSKPLMAPLRKDPWTVAKDVFN